MVNEAVMLQMFSLAIAVGITQCWVCSVTRWALDMKHGRVESSFNQIFNLGYSYSQHSPCLSWEHQLAPHPSAVLAPAPYSETHPTIAKDVTRVISPNTLACTPSISSACTCSIYWNTFHHSNICTTCHALKIRQSEPLLTAERASAWSDRSVPYLIMH